MLIKERSTHYKYLIVWLDNMLIMAKNTMETINQLSKRFTLKGIGQPEYFLGTDMKMVKEPEEMFTMGSYTYSKRILKQFETIMGYKPLPKIKAALDQQDHLELDNSNFVTPPVKKKYLSLMAML